MASTFQGDPHTREHTFATMDDFRHAERVEWIAAFTIGLLLLLGVILIVRDRNRK